MELPTKMMQTVLEKVASCDVTLYRVLGDDARGLTSLLARLNNGHQGYPGPNPVSIDREDYPKLRAQSYHIAEKTDGVRFSFLCCEFNGAYVCCIFDRGMTPYLLPLKNMPKAMAQGTIFDGELAWDSMARRWMYLIFDAVVVAGVNVSRLKFTERLNAARLALETYTPTFADPAAIQIKRFLPLTPTCAAEYAAHVEDVKKRHAVDGTVLMPECDHIVYGRHDNLFKLKTTHSIDFLVKNGKLCIYDENTKRNKTIGIPTGPRANLATEGVIVECVLDPSATLKPDKWIVQSVRTDKKRSNNKYTLEKTLLNMRERLQLADLIQGAFPQSTSNGTPIWD
jgi:hypothetical protein